MSTVAMMFPQRLTERLHDCQGQRDIRLQNMLSQIEIFRAYNCSWKHPILQLLLEMVGQVGLEVEMFNNTVRYLVVENMVLYKV